MKRGESTDMGCTFHPDPTESADKAFGLDTTKRRYRRAALLRLTRDARRRRPWRSSPTVSTGTSVRLGGGAGRPAELQRRRPVSDTRLSMPPIRTLKYLSLLY